MLQAPYGITPELVEHHGAWDHVAAVEIAKCRCLVSTESYVDHYGEQGLHWGGNEVTDVPVNLSPALARERRTRPCVEMRGASLVDRSPGGVLI